MKKMLSLMLILMLMLTMTCSAMAEDASDYDSVNLYLVLEDPYLTQDNETLLDLTGLTLQLDVLLSDSDVQYANLWGYTGDDYDVDVFYGYAQLDDFGLTVGADGLSNMYRIDTSDYISDETLAAITQLSLYSMVQDIEFDVDIGALELNIGASLIDELATEVEESEDGTTYTYVLEAEDQPLSGYLPEFLESALSMLDTDVDLDAYALTVTGEATQTVDDQDIINVELSGELTDGEDAVPLTITCEQTGDSCSLEISLDDGGDIVLEYIDDQIALIVLQDDETLMQIDGTFSMSDTGVDLDLTFTDEYEDAYSIALTASNEDGTIYAGLTVSYDDFYFNIYFDGYLYTDEVSNQIGGYFGFDLDDCGDTMAFDTIVYLGTELYNVEDWALDTSDAIDTTDMTESEEEALSLGLIGILGTAGTAANEYVPGLADIIGELISEVS